MAATDYVIVTGWQNAYLAKKKKPMKKGPQTMSEDRRPITEGEMNRLHDSEVRDSDIKRYEEQFGTRKCLDEGFRKQFWFTDNWDGSIHRYASLRKAKTEAKKQTGVSCCIHESLPYGRGSRIVCFAPASGFTPP